MTKWPGQHRSVMQAGEATPKSPVDNDNSAASQRSKILHHLQEIGPITTLQARHRLDICHPGMRVCELRKSGFPIETYWADDLTPEGNCHRVAKYVLRKTRQLSLLDLDNRLKLQEVQSDGK